MTNIETGASRREMAVARSLDSARVRAEDRFQRFLDAALDLMGEGDPGREFTVQEVVERSGQSLRLFYQYFGGKHELLLALFEELVRSTTEFLRGRIAEESDARARFHRFVVEYSRFCRPVREARDDGPLPSAWMMVDFAQQLLTSHPAEAAQAFAPLVALFGEILDGAAAAGTVRPELPGSVVSGLVLEAIMFNAFSATFSGTSVSPDDADPAEVLWEFIMNGVGVPAPK